MKENLIKDAIISDCGKYRYALWRVWDVQAPKLMFIGLNPSTADDKLDDPTIRRCINFTKGFGYGGFYMLNLFAYRATEPKEMKKQLYPTSEPAFPELNDFYLKKIGETSAKVVFCWGAGGNHLNRDKSVIKMFPEAFCLSKTKQNHPGHPLYLKCDSILSPYKHTPCPRRVQASPAKITG